MHISELDTPVMLVDLDRLERNIARMQHECASRGLANRPHIKTHKIPAIGLKQLQAGAVGITCQKVGEAEVFAATGAFPDILIPYNIVGKQKTERLLRLTTQTRLTVTADTPETVRGLSAAAREFGGELRVMVELDSGGHRAGVQSGAAALALARMIGDAPGLTFAGLMMYPTSDYVRPVLDDARERLAQANIPVEIISGGGTGAWARSAAAGATEHRAGTCVYWDYNCVNAGYCTVDDCAMSVLVTVVTDACEGYITVDGGSKTFTNDNLSRERSNGYCLEYPELSLARMNEEHGVVALNGAARRPKVGEKIRIIPNHACGTTNLHDYVIGHRDGRVEVVWPVAARGTIR
jgi:D-serine deaminase-like pyridoxal phosphate-dependent protein